MYVLVVAASKVPVSSCLQLLQKKVISVKIWSASPVIFGDGFLADNVTTQKNL